MALGGASESMSVRLAMRPAISPTTISATGSARPFHVSAEIMLALGDLDEVEQLAAQPQELRMLARGQLVARPRQIDLHLDADAARMRQQADHAVAEIDRLLQIVRHEQHRRRRWLRPATAPRPAGPAASSRRARRTARPSAAPPGPAPGSARSAGAAACRRTFPPGICRRDPAARPCPAVRQCAARASPTARRRPPAPARRCRRRCATAAAPCRSPGR